MLTAAGNQVRVDLTEDEQARLRALGTQLGNSLLVRALETLGHAVADMRGTDATDPRLTLEIALVRIARRDTTPPIHALVDRIERLEQALAGGSDPGRAAPSAAGAPPDRAGSGPTRRLGCVRRRRHGGPRRPGPARARADASARSAASTARAGDARPPAPPGSAVDVPEGDGRDTARRRRSTGRPRRRRPGRSTSTT